MRILHFFLYALLATAISVSCSSYEQTSVTDSRQDSLQANQNEEPTRNFKQLLAANRSSLSDVQAFQHHDLPHAFLQRDTTDNTITKNPFEGYRVQILSTREVVLADSVSKQFRLWADTTLTAAYQPKAYVFFKQPFYKVHVGDFQQRDKAIKLSQFLKRRYPAAWVVHDRINPSLVPADSTTISVK